ncbi:MAG TPA: hypothetical protein VK364_04740 [Hymenobacter sp.]|nr:hypothetical protein [Hymenobacter sp.]
MMLYENTAGVLSLGDEGNFVRIDWKEGQREDAHIQAIFEQALVAGASSYGGINCWSTNR